MWTDPALKSGISVRELISTKNNNNIYNKNAQAGNEFQIFSQILACEENSQHKAA